MNAYLQQMAASMAPRPDFSAQASMNTMQQAQQAGLFAAGQPGIDPGAGAIAAPAGAQFSMVGGGQYPQSSAAQLAAPGGGMMYAGGNPNFDEAAGGQGFAGGSMGGGQGFGGGMGAPARNPYMDLMQRGGGSYTGGFSNANPYLSSMADELQRRSNTALQQGLAGVRRQAVGSGGLGGSRQGVAEGMAVGNSIDSLQGNLANLFAGQFNQDANRGLQYRGQDQSFTLGLGGLANQRYGQDQQYDLGQGGLANQRYGMNQQYDLGLGGLGNQRYATNVNGAIGFGGLENQRRGQDQSYELGWGGLQNQAIGQDQNFYTQQRGQDLQQTGLGATLMQQGINMPWTPLQNASGIYGTAAGNSGTTTQGGQQGGGALGFLGGALGGAQLGKNAGWWG